jgi:hypothetical protein
MFEFLKPTDKIIDYFNTYYEVIKKTLRRTFKMFKRQHQFAERRLKVKENPFLKYSKITCFLFPKLLETWQSEDLLVPTNVFVPEQTIRLETVSSAV